MSRFSVMVKMSAGSDFLLSLFDLHVGSVVGEDEYAKSWGEKNAGKLNWGFTGKLFISSM